MPYWNSILIRTNAEQVFATDILKERCLETCSIPLLHSRGTVPVVTEARALTLLHSTRGAVLSHS